jgi:hypothetical protein
MTWPLAGSRRVARPRGPRPWQHTAQTPPAPAAMALTGPGFGAVSRAVPGSIRSSPALLVTAQTAPAPAVRSTTGAPVSTSGTTSARLVAGSTRKTSPPTASRTACRVTAMASTGELVATTLLMWDGPAGRSVARVGLVVGGEVGAGRVEDAASVGPPSRGCSHCPAASRPARATTATRTADTERWGRAKAVHLRADLPPGTRRDARPGRPVHPAPTGFSSGA